MSTHEKMTDVEYCEEYGHLVATFLDWTFGDEYPVRCDRCGVILLMTLTACAITDREALERGIWVDDREES